MAKPAIDIQQLSPNERLELIEELWDSLSEPQRDALELTAEQQAELDDRLDALEREGAVGVTPEELRARLKLLSS
jgi:putative addiction module component (TIGR02574 family)